MSAIGNSLGRGTGVARLALAALSALAAGDARAAGRVARPADSFVESMGINTHAAFTWVPSYANWDAAIAAVKDIGFRNVRDIPDDPDRLNQLTAATGAKVTVIVQHWFGTQSLDIDQFQLAWADTRKVNNVGFLELPNEPEWHPQWADRIRAWAHALHDARAADPVLKNVPMVSTWVWGGEQVADLRPLLDYGNTHVYPGGYTTDNHLSWSLDTAREITGPDKPVIATETGYHNAYNDFRNPGAFGISEAAAAKYMPRLYLQYFDAGVARTYGYALWDDAVEPDRTNPDAHFGLLRTDGSYKPAATALKNLIALLQDPGPAFTPSSMAYGLSGPTADVRQVLFQKRDGTFWLALWREVLAADPATHADLVVGAVDLTLDLPIPAVLAARFVPNESAAALSNTRSADRLNLAIDDRVTLLALRLAEPGDADANGLIDRRDLNTILANIGTAATWRQGDFDLDGRVTFADLQLFETNYGRAYAPDELAAIEAAAASVPEAGGAALLVIGTLTLVRRRRR
jgi:MYXO-CTERM domain-containing protein